jgi:hypothetical protein
VLQQLRLMAVRGFEPALLKQMPQLRVFIHEPGEGLAAAYAGPPDCEQQLVQVLPQLRHLQHLQLGGLVR